ncbi:hypothetical protein [Elizabethkingia miricola]
MNYIDTNLAHIIDAKEKHYQYLRYVMMKKLNGKYFTEPKPISSIKTIQIVNGIHSSVKKFLNNENNLKKVLIGTPEEIDNIKSKFKTKKEIASIKKLFNYDSWIDYSDRSTYTFYNAYSLAQNLDIPTCPYCNRMYTKTVIVNGKDKITRPTFDHWFLKSKYPLLALSFHNLVPSCTICNSGVKGTDSLELHTHFHPYSAIQKDKKILDFRYSYEHKDYSTFKFKIKHNNSFSKDSTDIFKLKEIYETHEDEITDLRRLRDVYSEKYLAMLKNNILKGTSISDEEIYRLAFGTHINEDKFDRRPLSKMKKDILEELGILRHI